MKKQLFLSLLVLLITLPLFAFKAIENTQQKAITQFALVDKSILTSGNLEIEDIKTIETDIDNAAIKHYDTDIQNIERLSYNTEMYEEVTKTEEDPIVEHDDARNILSGHVVQVGAYKTLDNATKIIEKLKLDHLYVYIDKIDNWNKVKIYGIKTIQEANLIIEEINEKFKLTPYLVREQ